MLKRFKAYCDRGEESIEEVMQLLTLNNFRQHKHYSSCGDGHQLREELIDVLKPLLSTNTFPVVDLSSFVKLGEDIFLKKIFHKITKQGYLEVLDECDTSKTLEMLKRLKAYCDRGEESIEEVMQLLTLNNLRQHKHYSSCGDGHQLREELIDVLKPLLFFNPKFCGKLHFSSLPFTLQHLQDLNWSIFFTLSWHHLACRFMSNFIQRPLQQVAAPSLSHLVSSQVEIGSSGALAEHIRLNKVIAGLSLEEYDDQIIRNVTVSEGSIISLLCLQNKIIVDKMCLFLWRKIIGYLLLEFKGMTYIR